MKKLSYRSLIALISITLHGTENGFIPLPYYRISAKVIERGDNYNIHLLVYHKQSLETNCFFIYVEDGEPAIIAPLKGHEDKPYQYEYEIILNKKLIGNWNFQISRNEKDRILSKSDSDWISIKEITDAWENHITRQSKQRELLP